jgi:hypothetical protein
MVMGNFYGRKIHKVTASDIDSLNRTNTTVLSSGNDSNGTYHAKIQWDTGGCGGASGGFNVKINNLVDGWRWNYITMKWSIPAGSSISCWNWNSSSDYGSAGLNGLLAYNGTTAHRGREWTTVDKVFKGQDCFDAAQAAGYSAVQMSRCDNQYDYNVFHTGFNHDTGLEKQFYMLRRRSTSTDPAGPSHSRSCNATGASAWGMVSDIIVFRL